MKIQTENCRPTPSTPSDSELLDCDLREFLRSARNQLRDPPEEDYDAYCERVFELVKSRRRIPKDFAKRYSPRRHRPTSAAWLAKVAGQARQYFLEQRPVELIDTVPDADTSEARCSTFNKEMLRFEYKAFRRSFDKYMSRRPQARHRIAARTEVIPVLEDPARFNLPRVPKLTISAEAVGKIFLELRKSFIFLNALPIRKVKS